MESRSVGELLRDLANDISRLIRDELALARSEVGDKLHQMIAALVSIIGGSLLGFAALIILLQAVVQGLSNHMPDWLASILTGGAVAIVGAILVYGGQKALSATRLAPDRTAENLRRDANLVREHAS
jgi:drug/metabolite transporter (DMT)-like permease